MKLTRDRWLRVAGLCGLISPLFSFITTLTAVVMIADFSWQANDLSDMGISATSNPFNAGLIMAGILSVVFALGMWRWIGSSRTGKIGAALLILGSIVLSLIGIVVESIEPLHFNLAVAYFTLMPLSYILLGIAMIRRGQLIAGNLSIVAAIIAIMIMVFRKTITHADGIAVPEMLTSIITNAWSFGLGLTLLLDRSKES
jgi:hypothetical membrane protein